ncbi:MAG: Lrp/AsnC family transcriptional regulator, partial [Janthinobacterium sp.]
MKISEVSLDATDLQILRLLQDEGRLSNARLAERLKLSETPVWRRLRRLEDEGFLTGYQALLNRKKLGIGLVAFVRVVF